VLLLFGTAAADIFTVILPRFLDRPTSTRCCIFHTRLHNVEARENICRSPGVSAELRNDSAKAAKGTLVADVDGKELKQEVELAAGETRVVRFGAEKFPQLKLAAPKLWWPFTIGTPYLYTAKFFF